MGWTLHTRISVPRRSRMSQSVVCVSAKYLSCVLVPTCQHVTVRTSMPVSANVGVCQHMPVHASTYPCVRISLCAPAHAHVSRHAHVSQHDPVFKVLPGMPARMGICRHAWAYPGTHGHIRIHRQCVGTHGHAGRHGHMLECKHDRMHGAQVAAAKCHHIEPRLGMAQRRHTTAEKNT